MSADRYSRCPRCRKEQREAIEAKKVEVDAVYGKASMEDFDALRAEVAEMQFAYDKYDELQLTLREDWELSINEYGSLYIRYSGFCQNCNFGKEFKHEEELLGGA